MTVMELFVEFMNFICYNVENIVKGGEKVKKFYYIFFICLVLISLSACGSSNTSDFSANYSSLPPEEWVWYEEGEYEAGIDISDGEYYIKENGDGICLGSILTDGEEISLICKDFSLLYLKVGDVLQLEKGKITQARNVPPISKRGPGTYRVGFDLPAGNYQIAPTKENAYFAVYPNAESLKRKVAFNSYSPVAQDVYVSEGQYLEVTGGEIKEAPDFGEGEQGIDWHITGMYQVGKDIQPGEYYYEAFPQEEDSGMRFSSYIILKEPALRQEAMISGNNLDPFGFLTVKEGDYLLIQHGKIAPASQIGPIEAVGDGMYRVGTDLPAGECRLRPTAEEGSLYTLLEDLSPESINGYNANSITEETTLSLKKGQYLMLQNIEVVK